MDNVIRWMPGIKITIKSILKMISSAHMRVRALRGVIAESAWEFLGYEGHELEKTPEFQVLVKLFTILLRYLGPTVFVHIPRCTLESPLNL